MDQNAKQQLLSRLQGSNNVLVTVSANPSVDQLSACIGLTLFLNKLGKHATAVFSGEIPQTIDFLKPGDTLENNTNSLRDFIIALDKSKADKLRYKVEDKIVKIFITPYRTSLSQDDLEFSQGDFNIEVVVALGVKNREDLDRAITAHGRILHDATVATINTGQGNNNLGSINWAQADASSLCEMAVDLAETLQSGSLDAQMATAFLTGIVAQTDRFSNTKTTPKTMSISSKLMAAGANQQLVSAKLQQPAAKKAADVKKTKSTDGTLEIPHDDDDKKPPEPPRELPPVDIPEDKASSDEPEEAHQIQIDEHGNIITSKGHGPIATTPPPPSPTPMPAPQRLTLNPPTLGGTLTANSRPEPLDPSTDPLGGGSKTSPLLSHESPPASTAPQVNTHQTLEEIEQKTGSKHLAQQEEQTKPDQSEPAQDAPSDTSNLDAARQAVEAAAQASPEPPSAIAGLGAQPLGGTLHPSPQPQQPAGYTPAELPTTPLDLPAPPAAAATPAPMPMPTPTPTVPSTNAPSVTNANNSDLPANLVPDKPLPPEQTGVSTPPRAPPPVPPPLMPPAA